MLIRLGLSNRLRRILKVLFQFSLEIFLRKTIINSKKKNLSLKERLDFVNLNFLNTYLLK